MPGSARTEFAAYCSAISACLARFGLRSVAAGSSLFAHPWLLVLASDRHSRSLTFYCALLAVMPAGARVPLSADLTAFDAHNL